MAKTIFPDCIRNNIWPDPVPESQLRAIQNQQALWEQYMRLEREQEAQKQRQQEKELKRHLEAIESVAYTASLRALKDLWLARWGDVWVLEETVEDDENPMWRLALQRLRAANELEEYAPLRRVRVKP